MPKRKYSDDEIEAALEIYKVEGVAEAARQTNIPAGTIKSWASRNDLATVATENRLVATEAARQANVLRMERITQKMHERAEWLLDILDKPFTKTIVDQKGFEHEITSKPEPVDVKNYLTGFGILADKIAGKQGMSINLSQNTLNVSTPSVDLQALIAKKEAENEAQREALVVQAREVTND